MPTDRYVAFAGVTPMQDVGDMDAVDTTTKEARASLSKMVFRLFEHWGIPPAAQASLLGLGINSRSSLSSYREGAPLANTPDLLERVGHLLAIHKSLRILFPYDPELRYAWVNLANRAFDGMTPLQVMLEYRFAGLVRVRGYLEVARGR